MTTHIRDTLTELIHKLDNSLLTEDDIFVLSMVAMVAKKENIVKTCDEEEKELLLYLTMGWFVNQFRQTDKKS